MTSAPRILLLLSSQSLILTIGQIHRMVVSDLLKAHSYEEVTLWTLLAGLAGLGISLSLLLRKGVLVPLQQLHEAAIRIADGQQELRLHSPRRDEFGQLADTFDHILDQIQETGPYRVLGWKPESENTNRLRRIFARVKRAYGCSLSIHPSR